MVEEGYDLHHAYTGEVRDTASGSELYSLGPRLYDPTTGRFLQPDPIVPDAGDPQAFNRYSYVLNSPLNFVDPSGLTPDCADRAGGCVQRSPISRPRSVDTGVTEAIRQLDITGAASRAIGFFNQLFGEGSGFGPLFPGAPVSTGPPGTAPTPETSDGGRSVSDLPPPGVLRNDSPDRRVRVLTERADNTTGDPEFIGPGESSRVESVYPSDGGPPIKIPGKSLGPFSGGSSAILRPDGTLEAHGSIVRVEDVLGAGAVQRQVRPEAQGPLQAITGQDLNPRVSNPGDGFPPGVPYDPAAGQ